MKSKRCSIDELFENIVASLEPEFLTNHSDFPEKSKKIVNSEQIDHETKASIKSSPKPNEQLQLEPENMPENEKSISFEEYELILERETYKEELEDKQELDNNEVSDQDEEELIEFITDWESIMNNAHIKVELIDLVTAARAEYELENTPEKAHTNNSPITKSE
jgi:hypothetical protein